MNFPGELWLEKIRLVVQSGFFALFLLALALSLGAVWKRRSALWDRCNRAVWTLALLGFVGMWGAGASLEMMRRAAPVSGRGLLVALLAFSVLLAGVVSLTLEWFPAREPRKNRLEENPNAIPKPAKSALRGDRIAGSLLALSLVGWWFGGFCGPKNALFALSSAPMLGWPEGWILALAGAQLLGAAQMVQSGKRSRVLNVRPATWWLLSFGAALAIPAFGFSALGASVALAGFGAFLLKIWGARPETRDFSRADRRASRVLIPLGAILPLLTGLNWTQWLARQSELWRAPNLIAPFFFFALLATFLLGGRFPLRLAIFHRFSIRALLTGVLAGALPATLFFGPSGALWWSFLPLAGVFYDLLAPHEPKFTEPDESDAESDKILDSDDIEPESESEIAVFAGSGRAQND